MSKTLPWADSPYSIKRHGLTLTNCESEPVQTPGCIQAHGALLVLRLSDLTVLQASENTHLLLGEPPESLLGQPIERLVGQESAARLRTLLDQPSSEHNAQYAFTHQLLDVAVHQIDGVGVLEFEATANKEASPDYLALVKSAVRRLQSTSGLREFCEQVSEEVRALTGLDRVMIYRFHVDNHGEVFSESKRGELPPWLGLHYPEADIPKQAREIFKKIGIRPLPDAAGQLIELVPLANPDTGKSLNMTHCALRGASVMYTEYLANMGVAASLTMPILCGGELWGLIACHHNTPTHFSYALRSACEFLAQVASLQLKSAEQNEQLHYKLRVAAVHQQLVTKAAKDGDLMALTDLQPSLLDALDAGGVALHHLDRWWCVGVTPSVEQLDSLADWLDTRPEFNAVTRPVFVTDSLVQAYPAGAGFSEVASGLLAVLLSRRRRDLILWFRPETAQTVSWAGNPLDKPLATGPHGPRLTPRRSFELFMESVKQRSLPWLPIEIDSALRLRILIMELVVSRSEQLNLLNKDLTQSNDELDAFAYVASHDLKEPLRGIHKYANQLLESALDIENQQRVESLLRLTVRMDSLLSSLLHFSRVGRTALERESVELGEVVDEALEMIGARRGDFNLHVEVPRSLPTIDCDRVRVREIFSNLLSNAKKYTTQELPEVEIGYFLPSEPPPPTPIPAEAQGQTIFYVRDLGIGIEARHFEQIFRMFKRLHSPTEFGGGVGAGLTIVQRLVLRHGGHIWLDSKVGVGSTFYFTLVSGSDAEAL
jgi:light-regulated signal transduction histidine kinase (bacteriophytochrome)